MSNITAPWWFELPRVLKEVFCNTEETKLKFCFVTLKNKISACKVALWIACKQALHLGESRFTRHKWSACEQAPLGRTIDNSAGLVSLVSSHWRSPFWGLFGLIHSHHTPHALFACLQLSPFSLEIIISRLRCLSTVWIACEFGILLNCIYREINLLVPIRGPFWKCSKVPYLRWQLFHKSRPRPECSDFLFKSSKEML